MSDASSLVKAPATVEAAPPAPAAAAPVEAATMPLDTVSPPDVAMTPAAPQAPEGLGSGESADGAEDMEDVEASEASASSTGKSQARGERGNKNLTYDERRAMLDFLLQRRTEGTTKLARHAITDAATEFHVDRRTVSRLWRRAVQSLERGDAVCDVASRKIGRRGRRKRDWSAELERVNEVPLNQRGSIRALASAVGIPKTTLFELLREDGSPKRVLNSIKPPLTDKNKVERLKYCASKVRANGLFDDMLNVVHINMKWFSLPRERKTKVMFMAAVARPQWDPHKGTFFDGKLGIWPFIREQVSPAMPVNEIQGSANATAPRCTYAAMEAVTKEDVQRMITGVIIPAVGQKMPLHMKSQPIFIQQDSAKIRSSTADPAMAEEGRKNGWNIQLRSLPPYSPDFTVMDNSLFKPIHEELKMPAPLTPGVPTTVLDELVAGVERGFGALTRGQLDDAFLSLQKTMENTMRVQGSNTYVLGNTSKERLQHEGSLPMSILCHPEAILACRAALDGATDQQEL